MCKLFRSYPDLKKGVQFMRDQSFDLDKSDVSNLIHALNKLDKIFMVVSGSSNKHLVIESHD